MNYARTAAVLFHNLVLTSALGKKLPCFKSLTMPKYESPTAALPLSAITILGDKSADKDQDK